MFFNRTNGGTGSLYNRVRKLRLEKDKQNPQYETNDTAVTNDTADECETNDHLNEIAASLATTFVSDDDDILRDRSPEKILTKLKSIKVTPQNIAVVKKAMVLTFDLRKRLLEIQNTDLEERFPFIFNNHILVMIYLFRILNYFFVFNISF